jgi:hypothetical protein
VRGGSRATVALLLTLLLTLPALASLTSSALTGEVIANDAPAAGVTVTATSRATQVVRTATTNARGIYWIGALTPGQYDITFSRTGLASLSRPATIELGRIARSDARLEPSEDEETVMSTVTTVSVAETTAITTHFWADELDRIPLRRDVATAAALSPTPFQAEVILDDTAGFSPMFLGEEALDEVTIVRGALPIELDGFGNSVILARTHAGQEEFSLSLRDTYSTAEGGGNVLESTSAGRIVPERLWFFAAGWGGEPTDIRLRKLRGLALKATAQATASHQFIASHFDADTETTLFDFRSTATSLRYTGVVSERLEAEAIVSRSRGTSGDVTFGADTIAAKLSYRLGDHVLSAGGRAEHWPTDVNAFYVSDRWSAGRWTVDTGVRRDDERTTPRIAAAFDLRSSRGSHAIVASWGEYLVSPRAAPGQSGSPLLRVATLGYTSSLESSGAARIDFYHFEGARGMDQVQADARYRMFDRLEAGGSYTYSRGDGAPSAHLGAARFGVQIPFAGHELAAMLLERYASETWITDFGVRYEVPIRRVAFTLAADATNLFRATSRPFGRDQPRAFRFWVRVRR